jgi:hypothetical protein
MANYQTTTARSLSAAHTQHVERVSLGGPGYATICRVMYLASRGLLNVISVPKDLLG